jgi:Reverse transcriptase (RNA-dependent DNA polymerase)
VFLKKKISLYSPFLIKISCHVITAYGLSDEFTPSRGVPQEGVKSPLISIFCCNICLYRFKQEGKCFTLTVYPMNPSPTMEILLGKTQFVKIQLTSFIDDLAIFFNNREDVIRGTELITSFNSIAGIRANPNKSAFIAIARYLFQSNLRHPPISPACKILC